MLHGARVRTCGEDGRWSGSAPVCANIECPSIEAPRNGGMRQSNGFVFNSATFLY